MLSGVAQKDLRGDIAAAEGSKTCNGGAKGSELLCARV